jgi:hypothetical protein
MQSIILKSVSPELHVTKTKPNAMVDYILLLHTQEISCSILGPEVDCPEISMGFLSQFTNVLQQIDS